MLVLRTAKPSDVVLPLLVTSSLPLSLPCRRSRDFAGIEFTSIREGRWFLSWSAEAVGEQNSPTRAQNPGGIRGDTKVGEALRMAYLRNGRNVLRQIIKDTHIQCSDSDRMMNPLIYGCQGIRFRKLEVILTTSIDKLGKAGETVKVAPGHFRNHLMPKLLAVPNIDKYAYLMKEQRKNGLIQEVEVEEEVKEVTVTEEAKQKAYQKAAKILDNARLVLRRSINLEHFRTRATKEDPIELKSPVTTDDIVAEVARQLCVHILPENLHLPSPLLTVGEYEVPLRLPKSLPLPAGKVQWTLTVKIRTA